MAQYRYDNKDKIQEQQKQYHAQNKEKCNEMSKLYYSANKEARNQTRKATYKCVCGSEIRVDTRTRHEKSAKHQEYIIF